MEGASGWLRTASNPGHAPSLAVALVPGPAGHILVPDPGPGQEGPGHGLGPGPGQGHVLGPGPAQGPHIHAPAQGLHVLSPGPDQGPSPVKGRDRDHLYETVVQDQAQEKCRRSLWKSPSRKKPPDLVAGPEVGPGPTPLK